MPEHNALKRLLIQLDFPRSALWRLQTDGCQQDRGPSAFRPVYYQGMDSGFELLAQSFFAKTPISANFINELHKSAFQQENITNTLQESNSTDLADVRAEIAANTETNIGFRKGGCSFNIKLPLQTGTEALIKQSIDLAAISEKGIPEIINGMLERYKHSMPMTQFGKTTNKPVATICISNNGKAQYLYQMMEKEMLADGSVKEEFKDKLINLLHDNLQAATRAYYNPEEKNVTVEIVGVTLGRARIQNYVEGVIAQARNKIEKASTENPAKVLDEIIELTRTLHQDHYFTDGNGRTFVFLLKNYLLLQHGLGLAITDYPAHFAGFSIAELKAETYIGIAKFSAYKITAAKAYLQGLNNEDIQNNSAKISAKLNSLLSSDNLIALDQLNELFLQIQEKSISLSPDYSLGGFYKFFTRQENSPQQAIFQVINDLYVERASAYIQSLPQNLEPISFGTIFNETSGTVNQTTNQKDIFIEILKRQELSANPDVQSQIDKQLNLHFASEQKYKF